MAEFLAQEGQFLLPMVQLIEGAELAVDELIDVMGRATICTSSDQLGQFAAQSNGHIL